MARAIQASLALETDAPVDQPPAPTDDMDDDMRQALEISKQQWEAEQAALKTEEAKSVPTKAVKPKIEKVKAEKPAPAEPVKKIAAKVDEPKPEPIKAPKKLAPLATAPKATPVPFDVKKPVEETKKKEIEKKVVTREEMKERMEKLKAQRDLLLKRKQDALQKEWNEFDDDNKEGGSRKDMIQKGLGALGISETSIKYKTEEEKNADKEKLREQKEKEHAAKDAAEKAGKPIPSKEAKPEPDEESDEMKRRRMIYDKIKKLNKDEGF